MDIGAWLRRLGLERYEQTFVENEIDVRILPKLTAEDLKDLGVTLVGHRRKLLEAIAALSAATQVLEAEPEVAEYTPTKASTSDAVGTSWAHEAERRQLTVLFCDLVGSTELAARLDPEEMSALVRAYQNAVTGEVARFEGHIAKFMGDGVLTYFGWPRAHEDEAERAVRAGLALIGAVAKLTSPTGEPLSTRVGIATGPVMVGELIGEGAAQERAVVGEAPNLAARLQTLAEPNAVVIARRTRRLVRGLFDLEALGSQALKGFAEPVPAWRVIGPSAAESRFEAAHAAELTPLIGREHEVGLLLDRFELAKGGEGQVVLLSGEPGIGKSRIARSLVERLAGETHARLRYYCSPYHTNSALYPVIGQLERAADLQADDSADEKLEKLETVLGQASEQVTDVAALLAALLSIPTDGRYAALNLTPQARKARTFDALLGQLEGLAAQQPLLIILEDAHWIDPTSVELFALVIDRIQRLPVLLLITFRPEFASPWTGHAHVTSLTLNRLGQRHGAVMVERIAGGKLLPAEVLNQILAKTDGVPLFVEELTKAVLESGLLTEADDRYELTGALPPLAIPATLHDSLMARLDRLAPVKEVAQIGAVIGREFSYELLAAVAGRSEDQLRSCLAQLVRSELIFRRGTPPEATYSFKHTLVQDAAYQSLLKSKRRQLHAGVARTLENKFSERAAAEPEILAHHLTEAGLIDQAVPQWLAAGERALQRSAYQEAVSHLAYALRLIEQLPPSPTRAHTEIRVQIVMGQALMPLRGPVAEVEAAFERAYQLCDEASQPRERFRASWGLWFCHYLRMNAPAMRTLSTRLLASARHEADSELMLQAHHAGWSTSWPQGMLHEAHRHAEAGLSIYEPDRHHAATSFFGGHDAGVCCRQVLGLTSVLMGYPDRAVNMVQQAVDLARRLQHPFTLAIVLAFSSFVHQLRRDAIRVRELTQAETDLCAEQGIPVYLAAGHILDAWAKRALDESLDVEPDVRDCMEVLSRLGSHLRRPYYLGLRAEICLHHARLTEGLKVADKAIAYAEQSEERWYEAELHRIKGALLISQSASNQTMAAASFARAIKLARDQHAKWLELRASTSLAGLWADQGRRAEAHDLLAPVYGWFTEGFDTPDLKDAKALLDALS